MQLNSRGWNVGVDLLRLKTPHTGFIYAQSTNFLICNCCSQGDKVSPAKRARSERVDELGMHVEEDQQRRPAYLDRLRGGQPALAHASAGSERELTSNARVGRVRKSVLKQIQKRRRRSGKTWMFSLLDLLHLYKTVCTCTDTIIDF